MAVCVAFGLSACGDNANVSQNAEVKKEAVKQANIQAELEERVNQMVRENIARKMFDDSNSLKIQKYVIDTFSANNIRMEPTLENYKWYAERELIPAWFEKKTIKEYKEIMGETNIILNFQKKFVNKNGEPNKKTMEIVKGLFFLDDGSFLLDDMSIENMVTRLKAYDAFMLYFFPAAYEINEKGDIPTNFFSRDRLKKVYESSDGFGLIIKYFAKEFIIDNKTGKLKKEIR